MQALPAEIVAVALQLVPVGVVLTVRRDHDRSLGELALDLPFAVAVDLLSVLLLSFALPLDAAAWVVRVFWLVYAAFRILTRTATFAWPRALTRPVALTTGGAALLGVLVSTRLSRGYLIHDRTWHGPLLPAIGGQELPFQNVFEGADRLRYHLGGDVFAETLRALSLDSMSSHRALGSAHDLLFALVAATAALLVLSTNTRRFALAGLAGLALLLSGPIPALRSSTPPIYAYDRFLNLSFRPHVPLAALLLTGLVGWVAVRARSEEAPKWTSLAPMVVVFIALGLTDEASAAMLGTSLFVGWIAYPKVLADERRRGAAWLALMALLGAAATIVFSGSLGAASPVKTFAWASAARVAPVVGRGPSALVASGPGFLIFLTEMIPFAVPALAFAIAARKTPSQRGAIAFAVTMVVLAALLGTHVDVNGTPAEAQRFFFAPFFVAILLGLLSLPFPSKPRVSSLAIVVVVASPALFSIPWLLERAPVELAWAAVDKQEWKDDLYALDCRAAAGAEMGQSPEPLYVDGLQFFTWTGCRPTFFPGRTTTTWPVRIFPLLDPHDQLAELDQKMIPHGEPLDVICRGQNDPVCVYAQRKPERCRRAGELFTRCTISQDERTGLLRTFEERAAPAPAPAP